MIGANTLIRPANCCRNALALVRSPRYQVWHYGPAGGHHDRVEDRLQRQQQVDQPDILDEDQACHRDACQQF